MGFLAPLFLISLLAALLPLLIHIVRFRKVQTVRFSSLAFLNRLASGTLRRIQVKRRLLLLLRMAALLLLALALARPVLTHFQTGERGADHLVLMIDNSPGMEQTDRRGRYMDQAVSVAESLVEDVPPSTRIWIEVTHGSPLMLPPMQAGEAISRLQQLEPLNSGNFFQEHLESLLGRLEGEDGNKQGYLITDGQAAQYPFSDPDFVPRNGRTVEWPLLILRVGEVPEENVAVTDLIPEYDRAREEMRLQAVVRNYSEEEVQNHELILEVDGEVRSRYLVNLEAGETASYPFEWSATNRRELAGFVQLNGDVLLFDNRRYFALQLPDPGLILLLEGEGNNSSWSRGVLEVIATQSDRLELEVMDWRSPQWGDLLERSDVSPSALILDRVQRFEESEIRSLTEFVQQGGRLMILPGPDVDLSSYNRLIGQLQAGAFGEPIGSYGSTRPVDRMAGLRPGHPVLDEIFEIPGDQMPRVDRPEIFHYYPIRRGESILPVLELDGGDLLMAERRIGRGGVILSAIGTGPDWSNLAAKPLFAPLFYRLVHYLAGPETGGSNEHLLGNPFELLLPNRVEMAELLPSGVRLYPEQHSRFDGYLVSDPARDWTPGWLKIRMDADSLLVAVNRDTMESDLTTLENGELESGLSLWFESVMSTPASEVRLETGRPAGITGETGEIWYWLLALAAFFLLIESLAARLFKAETIQ